MHILKNAIPLPWLLVTKEGTTEGSFFETEAEAEFYADKRRKRGKFAEVQYRPEFNAQRVGYL